MKKWIAALLCVVLLMPAAMAEKYTSMPYWQQMNQDEEKTEYLSDYAYIRRTYPDTRNDQIDQEIRQIIDDMTERGRHLVPPKGTAKQPSYLDTGTTISRTGEKWMSFLTITRVVSASEQIYLDYDARVYDMETGEKLTLSHLFTADSPAWQLLSDAVRDQLTAYFMTLTPDEQALNQLCEREALENTPFSLTPARLTLHFRADQLYPGKHTMMHVHVYYSQLREYMTEIALQNTDNSKYKIIALTYDDGGAQQSSMKVLDQLRKYGANATFFVVGSRIHGNHDVVCRQHDAGFSIQSHNYEHEYGGFSTDQLQNWKARFDQALDGVVGQRPTIMRAPGGYGDNYIRRNADMPFVHWSASSGDAGNNNVEQVLGKIRKRVKDGCVLLLHDLNPLAYQYSAAFLEELGEQGYLFVTAEELFSHYGVELEPNKIYFGCDEIAAMQQ